MECKCGHCGALFVASERQEKRLKYQGATAVYCSAACVTATVAAKLRRDIPQLGPCPTCRGMFSSRNRQKIFCSMPCYVASPRFKEVLAKAVAASQAPDVLAARAAAQRLGEDAACLDCGKLFWRKPSYKARNNNFCSRVCYRSYLAKRFDRWVANPETMGLPQCYDEFLSGNAVACLVDGCRWTGLHLTAHMNFAHGMRGDEFKRAAGFNLRTGVIARPLAEAMSERAKGNGNTMIGAQQAAAVLANRATSVRYHSLEGKEHRLKARALSGPGPTKTCAYCSKSFVKAQRGGKAIYCSADCRSLAYKARRPPRKARVRDASGKFLPATEP